MQKYDPVKGFPHNGRLVALGVTSKRSPSAPNVPAIGEHPALSGYELTGWLSLAAPKGLPADITEKLRSGLRAALQDPAYFRRLEDGGLVPATGMPPSSKAMAGSMRS